MNENQFNSTLSHFVIKDNMPRNRTVAERDAWFLIMNGKDSVRDFTLRLGKLYLE